MTPRYVDADGVYDLVNHPRVRPRVGPGTDPINIPEGYVCLKVDDAAGIFHPSHWPGVWMGHHAIHPDMWGKGSFEAAGAMLEIFTKDYNPSRIIGWTDERNKLACRFARRLGFEIDGEMPVGGTKLILFGKTCKWA